MTLVEVLGLAVSAYLGLGVICLAQVLYRRWRGGYWRESSELLRALHPERQAPWYRFREQALAPVLTALAIVLVWPLAVWIDARLAWRDRRERLASEAERAEILHPARGVRREHLRERLTRAGIEAQEIVLDPLGAAPAAPFGLLNGAWRSLVERERPGDEWWSFERVGRLPPHNDSYDTGRRTGRMRGYAIVRGGRPVAAFICEITRMRS
jgi:hypothetical protein